MADGSVRYNFTVLQSGFYYVAVSGDNATNIGGYRIAVSTGGTDDHGGELWDAKTVSAGTYSGNLERANDVDSFILNGTVGDRYFYTIDVNALDLFNTVDDQNNERLYADTVTTTDFVEVKFTETQKLKISFSSNTYTQTGAYAFTVQKAFSLDKDLMAGTAEDNIIAGSDLADEIWGLEGNDAIAAGNGEDFLVGSTGNDDLNGGAGSDTAFYFGRRSNYTVTQGADGSVSITDNRAGRDGHDTVTSVENFRFADGTFSLERLLTTNNTAPLDLKLSGSLEGASVPETATVIGILSATDRDNDAIAWSFDGEAAGGGNAGGMFIISNGQIRLAPGKALDYDGVNAVRSYTISVKASDDNGAEAKKAFTIAVTNVIENQVLTGGNSKDVLQGGEGNDKLSGGYGSDALFGGAGLDIFVFNTKLGTAKTDRKVNFDTIEDFTVGQDKIWLDNKIFTKLGKGSEASPGKLNNKFFNLDKAKAKDDYLVYSKKSGVLSYDADGSGSKAAIEIAQLSKNLKLSSKDFLIV